MRSFDPILAWDDGYVLAKNGTYAKVFELVLPPMFSMSLQDYQASQEELSTLLGFLPDYTGVHKMDVFRPTHFSPEDSHRRDSFLNRSFYRKYLERPYVDHSCYLTLVQMDKCFLRKGSMGSVIFKRSVAPGGILKREVVNAFKDAALQVASFLRESKYFDIRDVSKGQYEWLYNSYLNLDFSGMGITSDISQEKGVFSVGNQFVSAYALNSLSGFPDYYSDTHLDSSFSTDCSSIYFSKLYPLGQSLGFEHLVNQFFVLDNVASVKEVTKRDMRRANAFTGTDSENELVVEESTEYLMLMEKGARPVRYGMNVVYWGSSTEILESRGREVANAFSKIGFRPNVAKNEVASLFSAMLPGNLGDVGVQDQTVGLLNMQACSLTLLETVQKNSSSDFGIPMNDRVTGRPLFVDISDEPLRMGVTNNRNKVIFGPSGGGKSFVTNHMINNYLLQGAHCILVDVGDSYGRLCELHGGVFYEYREEDPISFNPFALGRDGLDVEMKESLITLIFTLWKKEVDDHTKDEYALLSEAIAMYYEDAERSGREHSFNTFYEFMRDAYVGHLKEEGKAELFHHVSFLNVLKMFYRGGEYDFLLNDHSGVDLLNSNFIVFELDNIKDHKVLFPVVTLVIMDVFIRKMRKLKGTRKVILIEEAWKAIAKEGMAGFMKYLFKTVRKHFGEAVVVTQDIEDIVGNEIVKNSIIKNCGAKILTDMKEYLTNFDMVKGTLSLSEKSCDLVKSINRKLLPGDRYKEVFIGLGNEGNVYGVNLSLEEYATYTTEKIEKERIEELFEEYGDMEVAIGMYADELKDKRIAV